MNKVAKRLLTFFIGLPAVVCIVWFNPFDKYHIPLQIVALIISILGSNEFYNMLSKKYELFPRWAILFFDALVFVSQYIFMIFGYRPELNIWVMAIVTTIFMGASVFRKNFDNVITKLALSIFIILYCGFLFSFIPSLTYFKESRFFVILFLIIVFMCDSAAWFFGILFGKNNRGLFPASPNKSVVGFIGGIAGAIVFACLVNFAFSSLPNHEVWGIVKPFEYWKICIIALFTALSGIVGDLIESVFKRDCGVKDSGNLIPGRGGVMDCMDSLSGAAAIYFVLIYFLLSH